MNNTLNCYFMGLFCFFYQSMVISVHRDKPAMLNVVGKAINGIFDGPTDVFLRVKVLDILFRGIIINCDRTEFAPKAACTTIKKEVTGLVFEPNNQFRFSLFGMVNLFNIIIFLRYYLPITVAI